MIISQSPATIELIGDLLALLAEPELARSTLQELQTAMLKSQQDREEADAALVQLNNQRAELDALASQIAVDKASVKKDRTEQEEMALALQQRHTAINHAEAAFHTREVAATTELSKREKVVIEREGVLNAQEDHLERMSRALEERTAAVALREDKIRRAMA
jgi:chromosome segregation ATPase